MIHEELVTYEVAKVAKEKGFNEKCNFYYQKGVISTDGCFNRYNKGVEYICSAPTQSLLQRWLREEKKISVEVSWFEVGKKYFWVAKDMNNHDVFKPKATKCMTFYDTLEQALEMGLEYALKELE